ncbi:hypothetical protein H4582DRAFT_2007233 [Lactarius indigo]|nr:hypothetical protein H4582DRAFT_2007233 [Lactarius indigo]
MLRIGLRIYPAIVQLLSFCAWRAILFQRAQNSCCSSGDVSWTLKMVAGESIQQQGPFLVMAELLENDVNQDDK